MFPVAECALRHENALELLVATILSAQCTDARVNIVTKPLFARYRNVREYADADREEVEDLIRSSGFFRNKTKSIMGMARMVAEEYEDRRSGPGAGWATDRD